MSYKITVASGKGGTGKTTVAVNLFHFLKDRLNSNIQLVDCDVEEPNDVIFFPNAVKINQEKVSQFIPEIDIKKCTFCRKCVEYCEFNAIVVIPTVSFAEVNSSLCHSCGACLVACGENAISEIAQPIGHVNFYDINSDNPLAEGNLKIGSAMQTMLIKELKKHVSDQIEIVIYDAPPGTSCPVVETIVDADYIILVTEPTPFGLHDLKLMVNLLDEVKKPFGVIINKAGLGNNDIYELIEKKGIELLGEIPFTREYASHYAAGNLLSDIPEEISLSFKEIVSKLENRIIIYEGNNYFKW
ncbi:MAG: ATP-binding protein [Bacteroidales bacterium]|nr:ATP-binding protein [Bacteroidales bacterium]